MRVWTLIPIVAMLYGCSDRPMKPGTITYIRVVQSESPAGPGTVVIGPAGVEASVPASHKPPDAPKPPTPTARALGGLVWLGGAILALGVVGVGLRFLPWTAAVGKIVPIGLSVGVALAGVVVIAVPVVLSKAPWWATWASVAGVIAVGALVAMRDNWKLLKR